MRDGALSYLAKVRLWAWRMSLPLGDASQAHSWQMLCRLMHQAHQWPQDSERPGQAITSQKRLEPDRLGELVRALFGQTFALEHHV
jgi:hypothetical protein